MDTAQFAVLPHFSNKATEDQFTPAQWLQKVISHKEAAQWTDAQTITHFRNALRGTSALEWFSSLEHLGVDTKVWSNVKTRFVGLQSSSIKLISGLHNC